MVEASGDKFNNLKDLCFNWIQKAGLNEISLDIDYDKTTNKINNYDKIMKLKVIYILAYYHR